MSPPRGGARRPLIGPVLGARVAPRRTNRPEGRRMTPALPYLAAGLTLAGAAFAARRDGGAGRLADLALAMFGAGLAAPEEVGAVCRAAAGLVRADG